MDRSGFQDVMGGYKLEERTMSKKQYWKRDVNNIPEWRI